MDEDVTWRVVNSAVVDRHTSDVFAAWLEPQRIPDWFVDSIELGMRTERPVGVGTTYQAFDEIGAGRRIVSKLEVTQDVDLQRERPK